MTSPNSEYFFEEESDHISRNEQQEINADAENLRANSFTYPPDAPYCVLILTQGQVAYVSPNRYAELSRFTWFAWWSEDTQSFYAMRKTVINGKEITIRMHRDVLGMKRGDKRRGDHRNNITLDNRDENLRISTSAQNASNRSIARNNTSGNTGVYWRKDCDKWCSLITTNGRRIFLGVFNTFNDAKEARRVAADKYHGEFSASRASEVSSVVDIFPPKGLATVPLPVGNIRSPLTPNGVRRKGYHGMVKTPTYGTWSAMVQRICNPANPKYPVYGGRGIDIDPRWREFKTFLSDMGERPKGTTIGRIDNDRGYWVDNCEWQTAKQQQNNTTQNQFIEIDGDRKTAQQWSDITDVKLGTILWRLHHSWPKEKILQPARPKNAHAAR